ncbi:hypothetical protein [Bdellovibrio bacteriovorus]|uniref:hypothetical protein n=1 Tax=Bdellovibrio bacteriovorus TaxID=959 RepID=UPI0035A73F94
MRLGFILLNVLVGTSAVAVDYPLPAGHREAFMANTGAAMVASPGNVLFNPAGLGFRDTDKLSLSVSGNAISSQKFDIPYQKIVPQEMTIRPTLAASIYPTTFGTGAFFVANPLAFQIIASSSQSLSGGYFLNSTQKVRQDAIVIGGSFGSSLGERFAWGVSGGVQTGTDESTHYFTLTQGGAYASTQFAQRDEKKTAIIVIPGIMAKVTEAWTVGLSMKLLPFFIESTATEFSSKLESTSPTTIQETVTTYDPQAEASMAVRLGQNFSLIGGNRVNLDVVYNSQSKTRNADGTIDTSAEDWFYAFGWRNTSPEGWEPLFGYARGESEPATSDLITAGVSITKRRNEIIVGAFHMGTTPKSENGSKFSSYGIMFSSNVAF